VERWKDNLLRNSVRFRRREVAGCLDREHRGLAHQVVAKYR